MKRWKPEPSVTVADVRLRSQRENALMDNLKFVYDIEQDVWDPQREPTLSGYIDAVEERGFTTKCLGNMSLGEHVEVFYGVYAKNFALIALIHSDHMGIRMTPTDEWH